VQRTEIFVEQNLGKIKGAAHRNIKQNGKYIHKLLFSFGFCSKKQAGVDKEKLER
jgi:hypothetical protein